MILLDTNILLRFTDSVNPDCQASRTAVHKLRQRGESLVIVPQNLYEFWAVATRPTGSFPRANGLGLSTNRTDLWTSYWNRNFTLLVDTEDLVNRWRTLVRVFTVVGKKSHDARLVAAMQSHNITDLLTFNTQDFKRFPNISLLNLHTV